MNKRFFGLDILRAIAIIMVVIEHGSNVRYLGAKMGTLGVEIFFVLSGFLIGQILLRDFEQGVNFKKLLHFWKRRWIRTIPVYYLVLFLKFVIAPAIGINIIWYFLFLQNNIYGIDFFGVSWSLVIEEWFYLLIPFGLLILLYNKKFTNQNIGFFILLVIVSINLLRYFWVDMRNTPFGGIVGQIPLRLDTMIVGVGFAYLKKYWNPIFLWLAKPLGFILAIIIFHLYVYAWGVATELKQLDTSFWFRTGHFITLSLCIGLLIPYLDAGQMLNNIQPKNLIRRVVTWVSLISYSLYLTHTDIAGMVQNSLFLSNWQLNNYLFAMVIAFSLSTLLYFYFEKPILKWRDRK
jgi:peptidoglycan/LPS O-acetylase OafA/YrhL